MANCITTSSACSAAFLTALFASCVRLRRVTRRPCWKTEPPGLVGVSGVEGVVADGVAVVEAAAAAAAAAAAELSLLGVFAGVAMALTLTLIPAAVTSPPAVLASWSGSISAASSAWQSARASNGCRAIAALESALARTDGALSLARLCGNSNKMMNENGNEDEKSEEEIRRRRRGKRRENGDCART